MYTPETYRYQKYQYLNFDQVPHLDPKSHGWSHIWTPIVSIALYGKMQSFGATLKFYLHFFALNGITQIILVAFSIKMSGACSGALSSENGDFKFFETAKT